MRKQGKKTVAVWIWMFICLVFVSMATVKASDISIEKEREELPVDGGIGTTTVICIDSNTAEVIKTTVAIIDLRDPGIFESDLEKLRVLEIDGKIYEYDEANPLNKVKKNKGDSSDFHMYYRRRFELIFNTNGGTCETEKGYANVGLTYGELPVPAKKGFSFKGWYTKKAGGKRIKKSTIVKLTKNQTLYARWEKIQLKKVAVTSAKSAGPAKAAIKWEKVSGAKGYEITYAYNKKFKNPEKKTVTKNYVTLKKLEKGKTCYVKVQAYKKDSTGEKTYGKYSEVQKIEVK